MRANTSFHHSNRFRKQETSQSCLLETTESNKISIKTIASLIVNMMVLNYSAQDIKYLVSKTFEIDRELVELAFMASSYVLERNIEAVLAAKTAASAVLYNKRTVEKAQHKTFACRIAAAATVYVEEKLQLKYLSKDEKNYQLLDDKADDEKGRKNDEMSYKFDSVNSPNDTSTATSYPSSTSFMSVTETTKSSVTLNTTDTKARLTLLTAEIAKAVRSAYEDDNELMQIDSLTKKFVEETSVASNCDSKGSKFS